MYITTNVEKLTDLPLCKSSANNFAHYVVEVKFLNISYTHIDFVHTHIDFIPTEYFELYRNSIKLFT